MLKEITVWEDCSEEQSSFILNCRALDRSFPAACAYHITGQRTESK